MPQLGRFEKVLRVGEGRRLKRLAEQAAYVATLEPDFEKLSDDELAAKTVEFRQRLENGESLEELLFEAFAAVREAVKRESRAAALRRPGDGRDRPPRGRHRRDEDRRGQDVRRDAAALPERAARARASTSSRSTTTSPSATPSGTRPVYERARHRRVALHREHDAVRRAQRRPTSADITYGTNSEFGFDYLRDNMAVSLEGVVQRGHAYAIVDEVDSILIDEARTPLIISGEPETAAQVYYDFARIVKDARRRARRSRAAKGEDERAARRRLPLRREVQDGLAERRRRSRRSSARSGSTTSTTRATSSSSTT